MPYTEGQVKQFPEMPRPMLEDEDPAYIRSSQKVGYGHASGDERMENPNQGFPEGEIKPSFNSGPNGVSKGFDA
jgi:hypothetical protein